MATTTSKINKLGNNYYQTSVTTNADGSLKAITYRTDAKGSTQTPVFSRTTTPNGQGGFTNKDTLETGATAAEKAAFKNPNSPEGKIYSQQVQSLNPANSSATQKAASNAAAGKGNQATNSPQSGDNQQQGESGDPDNKALKADLANGKSRNKFSQSLVYPITLKAEFQDVIQFNMLKYEPRKAGSGDLGTFGARSNYTSRTIGVVTLPVPSGISDTNSVNWGADELTSAQKALADLATAGITGGGQAAADKAGEQIGQVGEASGEIKTGLAAYFTEQAVGVKNILSRTQGAIQNPNMELLFQGPQLRPFSFTFKLSARSEPESKRIREIIRFFKQGMSPIRSESNLFLKAPHTFQIRYLHKNKDHDYLNRFKECALQSFTVDYTPEGQYATFHTGAMVSYQITMQLQELEPVFNSDYTDIDGDKDTAIGY